MENSTDTVKIKVTVAKYDGDAPGPGEVKEPIEVVEREFEVPLAVAQKLTEG